MTSVSGFSAVWKIGQSFTLTWPVSVSLTKPSQSGIQSSRVHLQGQSAVQRILWARLVVSRRSISQPFLGAWQVPSNSVLGPMKNSNIPARNSATKMHVPMVNSPSRILFFLREPISKSISTVEACQTHQQQQDRRHVHTCEEFSSHVFVGVANDVFLLDVGVDCY